MAKKYTMEEFEQMFLKAQRETLAKLNSISVETAGEEKDSLMIMAFNMQNMMCIAELHSQLFGKKDK